MPIYEYCCPKCGMTVEVIAKITDERVNPVCTNNGCDGNVEMKRTISTTNFVCNGSGWTPKFYGRE